ncbi:MAG: hypothetical protein M1823_006528, partial [Watsoniomyces obsoletus]
HQSFLVAIFGVAPDIFPQFASKVLGEKIPEGDIAKLKEVLTNKKIEKAILKELDKLREGQGGAPVPEVRRRLDQAESLGRQLHAAIESREIAAGSGVFALDEKVDRRAEAIEARVSETNQRVDRILEGQTSAAERTAQIQTDLNYVKDRIDRIAEKLEVAALPNANFPYASVVSYLKGAGVHVWNAKDLQEADLPAFWNGVDEVYVFTPDPQVQQKLMDALKATNKQQ